MFNDSLNADGVRAMEASRSRSITVHHLSVHKPPKEKAIHIHNTHRQELQMPRVLGIQKSGYVSVLIVPWNVQK